MTAIAREFGVLESVSLTAAIATTPEIGFESYSGGEIIIPSGSSITLLTWHTAEKNRNDGGTEVAAYGENGVAVTQTVVADGAYPIPSALFGCRFIYAVVNIAGAVDIILKG